MQQELNDLKTEVLVRLAKLEAKVELLDDRDSNLKADLDELKKLVNENFDKIDAKVVYIERDMPSASTYRFIIVVVGIVLTAAVGLIMSFVR